MSMADALFWTEAGEIVVQSILESTVSPLRKVDL